jgi:hypothetical protein
MKKIFDRYLNLKSIKIFWMIFMKKNILHNKISIHVRIINFTLLLFIIFL